MSYTPCASSSRPVRARGLKPDDGLYVIPGTGVAPRVGAWIETYTGAMFSSGAAESRPVRARGLKHP